MVHAHLKNAILLHKMANVRFDLLLAVYNVLLDEKTKISLGEEETLPRMEKNLVTSQQIVSKFISKIVWTLAGKNVSSCESNKFQRT